MHIHNCGIQHDSIDYSSLSKFHEGNKNHYLIDGGPTTLPSLHVKVHFFANLLETLLKYSSKATGDVFKADGIMVTHKHSDHNQGVQKLLDDFHPNQDPEPGNARFEFRGPLLINDSSIDKLGIIHFKEKKLNPGDTIDGFENLFTFYYPDKDKKGQLYYYEAPPIVPRSAPSLTAVAQAAPLYKVDSSKENLSSILLTVADPSNTSEVLVSLNGDSVGYLVLQALESKSPTFFKVPHHGSHFNSLPLQTYKPDALRETKQLLAALALLQLSETPTAPNLLANDQVTTNDKSNFKDEFGAGELAIIESASGIPVAKRIKIDGITKEALQYDKTLSELAKEFKNQLISKGVTIPNLLSIFQRRMERIEANLKDSSIASTQVYTNGMSDPSLKLPDSFNYQVVKSAVFKAAKDHDKQIKAALGIDVPVSAANLPYSREKAFKMLFGFLETDLIFQENVLLHLTTSFYQQIKARSFLISSGDRHEHPHWEVVAGIIQAAQNTHKSFPTYTCRLLLTSGYGIDESKLPDNTTDDWTQYVSLQYFGGETASVSIDPHLDPLQVPDGAMEWRKGSLNTDDLLQQYNNTAGALELKRLRTADSGRQYEVKPAGQNYWLDFTVDSITKMPTFQLLSSAASLKLTHGNNFQTEIDKKPMIIFELYLTNKSNEVAIIYSVIGSHVPQSGVVSYKLFEISGELNYVVASGGSLSTSTDFKSGSYFVFQSRPPTARTARSYAAYAKGFSVPISIYLRNANIPHTKLTCNDVLRLLQMEPVTTNSMQVHGLQSTFYKKMLTWNVAQRSTVAETSASLVMEVPTSSETMYQFVVASIILQVDMVEQKIDAVIDVSDDTGMPPYIRHSGLSWIKAESSGDLTLAKLKDIHHSGAPRAHLVMDQPANDENLLSLSAFLEWAHFSGDSSNVSFQTVLSITVSEQVTTQLLASGKLSEESHLYKFIEKMLPWDVSSSSTFEVTTNTITQANIQLVIPSEPLKFQEFSVSSISVLIDHPISSNISMKLQLDATDDDGDPVSLIYQLDKFIEQRVQTFQEYLAVLGVKGDPQSYNFFDSIMFLLGSETDSFLSLISFTRALVSTALEWKVNLKQSNVTYIRSPIGPQLLEATLTALIPDKGNTLLLGISKVFHIQRLSFIVPSVLYSPEVSPVMPPYIKADVTIGEISATITTQTPQNGALPSLRVEISQNVTLSDVASLLNIDSSIASLNIPMLSGALKDIQITAAGFTIQQAVKNSKQSWLSSVFFGIQFMNVSSYLPAVFSSLKDINASVVVYQPLLPVRKIGLNVDFHFEIPVEGNDGNMENVNLAAILRADPLPASTKAESSYNFSVALQVPAGSVGSHKGISIANMLKPFGLEAAMSSAESIPFLNSLLQNVLLREVMATFNTGIKTIQSFTLGLYIPNWKLIPNKLELSRFDVYLSYSDGDWETRFEGDAEFGGEYSTGVQFQLSSGANTVARFSFSNTNYDFTIKTFLSVFGLGSISRVPVLDQILDIAVTGANLSLMKSDSGVRATEGQVSLYRESINISSIFRLSQVDVTIGFVSTVESDYVFGFSVRGFINQKIFLSAAYDPNNHILSGQALIASFKTASLSDVVETFLPSDSLDKSAAYSNASKSLTAAISVAFKLKSGDFTLQSLAIDLRNVFTIGSISLEQLKFEYSTTDGSESTVNSSGDKLPSTRSIKLIGVLTGKEKSFSAIIEFDLTKDSSGASTITASIRPAERNTLTLLSFLSLFGVAPPPVPSVEGRESDMPQFFDLALKKGSLVLSLPDFSVSSFLVQVETPHSVQLLDSPNIILENLSFEVNYDKSSTPTTTGTLLGVISLLGIKVAIEGSKEKEGTVFKAVVGPDTADLQDFIRTLTPSDTTTPMIPSNVGLPQSLPVSIASLTVGLLTNERSITFSGTSQQQWTINLGFSDFQIQELGGFVNYTKSLTGDKSSKFSVYVTGQFQFLGIQLTSELHFGVNMNTVLAVLVRDASQVKVDSVADNLLGFGRPKPPSDSNLMHSNDTSSGASNAFHDLLPDSTTTSIANYSSAYINLNLSQSVFLLVGTLSSLGTGFLLAGKFSSEQTSYGYAFGISFPHGFKFSQLLDALSPIDDILQVRKLNCLVVSLDIAKVSDVVQKMKTAQESIILPKGADSLTFPFSDLNLDEATNNLAITKGMSFYAEFDITAASSDSIVSSIIQISHSPDVPTITLSVTIAKDPIQSEFRAHLQQLLLLGLLEFNDITLIYRPKSMVTLELRGTITVHIGESKYAFYGMFHLTKTEAVFSVMGNSGDVAAIHEPLGMFGISLEEAQLSVRYSFPKDKPHTSDMKIVASVNFYSSDSLNTNSEDKENPVPVLSLSGLVIFQNYTPVVASITVTPTKPLTIADFVATVFKWKYNLQYLNIGFVNGQIYYCKPPQGEQTVTVDDVVYNGGYHISADTNIFSTVFTIEANIPVDKSEISITGYAKTPIDLGFAKLTGKNSDDPGKPDESKSPELTFMTSSTSTSISISIGLILFQFPLATAEIGYNLTRKVFSGTLTYNGSIGFISNPSITCEWSKENGLRVTNFPMSGAFDFNLFDKLRNFKDRCGSLVDLAFKKGVQTKFDINTKISKTKDPQEFLADLQITGTYDVLLAGKTKIASIPLPDLSVGIPREEEFTLHRLPQFILDLFTKNSERIIMQIMDNPQRLAAILGIVALKTITKRAAQTLICRKLDKNDLESDENDDDFTSDDFEEADEAESEFDSLFEEFEALFAADEIADAVGFAAGAEEAAPVVLGILAGIVSALGIFLALLGIVSLIKKKQEAEERQKRIMKKQQEIRRKMQAALDIREQPKATFTPPNQLTVSWKPIPYKGAMYHLKVVGSLLPPQGGATSETVVLYDKVVADTRQTIIKDMFYNVVGVSVTVNGTLTGSKDGYTSTFNGKSYTASVANVHPTLHAPAKVNVEYAHESLKITASASSVEYAKAYYFELVEVVDTSYTVIAHSTITPPLESVSFDHSSIPQTSNGPFKVRCRAVGENDSVIAHSAFTYSTDLSLLPPPKEFALTLSHFEESKQDITLNWSLPTSSEGISGFFCQVVHKQSKTSLVSHELNKPMPTEDQPQPPLPTSYSFTIGSVVQALTDHGLIPTTGSSVNMDVEISSVSTNGTIIDSVFITSTITSLKSPQQVDLDFDATENNLYITWLFTQETSTYGIQISDASSEIVFSRQVTVNKDSSKPAESDPKVGYSLPYSELSQVNDPSMNYIVKLTAVAAGNEELDSLLPSEAPNSLQILPTPTDMSLQFKADTTDVSAEFNSVPNASGYLFQLLNDSNVLSEATIQNPSPPSDLPSVIHGNLSINNFIDQLTGGDEVHGTVQALGGGNVLSSSISKFTEMFTVFQPPADVGYTYSPGDETITLTCTQVQMVPEYLLGLLNMKNDEVVSENGAAVGQVISATLSTDILRRSEVKEWKAFAQSVGDVTHLSSPHTFHDDIVHILPAPILQPLMFESMYSILSVTWSTVTHATSYNLEVSALKGDQLLKSFALRLPASNSNQDIMKATVNVKENFPGWESVLKALTSLSVSASAIGANFYITSSISELSSIKRFDPPQNLKYAYASESDIIMLTCDTVKDVPKYTLGLRGVNHPYTGVVQTVDEQGGKVSVSLSGSDVRNVHDDEWMVICLSAGDSTHFPSTEVTLESNVKVIDSPIVESITYNSSDHILHLSWSSVQGASAYAIKVVYRDVNGKDNSFEVISLSNDTSANIDMNQKVQNWTTGFPSDVASIFAKITAVGSGYYISSSALTSPILKRLAIPDKLQITSDGTHVTITWTAVPLAIGYSVLVKIQGNKSISQHVKESLLVIPAAKLIKNVGYARVYHATVRVTADSNDSLLPSFTAVAKASISLNEIRRSPKFGGNGGMAFEDPIETLTPAVVGIKSLRFVQGSRVDSIQVTYLLADGSTYATDMHGRAKEAFSKETYIELAKGEEIVKVVGKTNGFRIGRLVFITKTANGTERRYGPLLNLGASGEGPFTVVGKILGLFGRSDYFLDAVGFYFVPIPLRPLTTPLYGSPGRGTYFQDLSPSDSSPPQIVGINVYYTADQVLGVQVTYLLDVGATWTASKHGSDKGSLGYVEVDVGENIIGVDVKTNGVLIEQITFHIEKADGARRRDGPYGKSGSPQISVTGRIVGLFGLSGDSLNAIGFRYTPIPRTIINTELFGGGGGEPFSDNHSPEIVGIKTIIIEYGDRVSAIQATYRLADGSTWMAPKHGGTGKSATKIQLADDENIVLVEGQARDYVVDQLAFKTRRNDGSQRTYGPFGRAGKSQILVEYKVLAFFGRSEKMLNAIGFFCIPRDTD